MNPASYVGWLGDSLPPWIPVMCYSPHPITMQPAIVHHCQDRFGQECHPLTIRSLQTGVTLSMVLLIGLGSDQVNKSSNNDNLIEAYHLYKHRSIDGKALRDCLLWLNKQEAYHVSIFLYALPQFLQVGTFWYQCLLTLSSCNMIWLIVIDEAHTVTQDGCSFQPEFWLAMESLKCIYDNQPNKCNQIAMSATFSQSNPDVISNLFGQTPDKNHVVGVILARDSFWCDYYWVPFYLHNVKRGARLQISNANEDYHLYKFKRAGNSC